MDRVVALINGVPLAGLMTVVVLGYTLGRLRLRGISTGPAGGTLFVALALGHLGLSAGAAETPGAAPVTLGTLGFALFIYSVGFDAAPHFLASWRDRRAWKFIGVACIVNAAALVTALLVARAAALDGSTAAGVLSGALTSAPTFAAASEVAGDPSRLSVAFALTYPFGLIGLVLAVQLLPRLTGEVLSHGAATDAELGGLSGPSRQQEPEGGSPEVSRSFEVRSEEVTGRPLRELDLTHRTGCLISRVRRAGKLLFPTADTVLEQGDHVLATGRVDELHGFADLIGPEAFDAELEQPQVPPRRIEVRSGRAVGRSLASLGIIERYHCIVTRVERGRLWLEPNADVVLVRGDVVEVVGERDDVRRVASLLGRFEVPMNQTDIAVYVGGILLGLLVGSIHLRLGSFDLKLGMAGGLLVAGLVLGAHRNIGPLRTHVPTEARQLVRDLGILLFVGETGLLAGARLVEGLRDGPLTTIAAGAAITTLTILTSLAFARALLRLRPVDAWGSIAGGLTSSAALHAVRQAADSNEAAISYAAAYGVASVLATIAGPVVVLLLS